ncbi:hypothetical protein [Sulfuriferula nivalis]|uniref:Uncharacterized protein n=1 Tax=Sulfuriferula nivalis TaxID=2675298 RepID=A0A809RE36_9PROT|nr:hypothetical protein [Sulfuriferula nivalis]BBP00039.1 hypothetical protein SFSGTM_07470 [Sulfuriferula nivalis]
MTKPSLQPSLLDNTDTYQAKKTGPSLLASLSNSTTPPPPKKRSHAWLWFVLLPLILISMVVAAAIIITDRVTTPASTNTPVNTKPAAAPAVAAKPEPAPIQAATIINDAVTNNPHDRLTNALAGPQTISSTAPTTQTVPTKMMAANPASSAPIKSTISPAATKTAMDKRHDNEPDDRDVKLLTALVASSPIAREEPAKAHPSKTKHNTTKTQPAPKDDSRDVVERRPGDSTASLLARCKKLGMIEGELCRWRICSDRWDTDPVCKVNAHVKSSTPDNPAQ